MFRWEVDCTCFQERKLEQNVDIVILRKLSIRPFLFEVAHWFKVWLRKEHLDWRFWWHIHWKAERLLGKRNGWHATETFSYSSFLLTNFPSLPKLVFADKRSWSFSSFAFSIKMFVLSLAFRKMQLCSYSYKWKEVREGIKLKPATLIIILTTCRTSRGSINIHLHSSVSLIVYLSRSFER